jgi:hypothetical protein
VLELERLLVVVEVRGLVADLVVEDGVAQLELLRHLLRGRVLERGAVHHRVRQLGRRSLGQLVLLLLLHALLEAENMVQVLHAVTF